VTPDIQPESSLATRATVLEIVRAYEQSCADIRTAFVMLDGAEKRINDAVTLGRSWGVHLKSRNGRVIDFGDVESTIAHVRREVWSSVVERLEIRRMLSIARAKELDEQLERGELPEITEENVYAFANGYMRQLDTMIAEAVREVFEILRPPHSQYKTNTELEIGERVILAHYIDPGWSWGPDRPRFHLDYHREKNITALENVFRSLDGKGAALPTNQSELQMSINASPTGQGVTTYFAWKGYKNGTLHIRFLRPDLVTKLNQIAGGMRLRPRKEAA
jgi:hypothetical protein